MANQGEENQGGEEHQFASSEQFLRRLSMNYRGEGPSRSMHKRVKFGDKHAKTDFPKHVSAMETEIFRTHHTEEEKVECLRLLVAGDYASKVAEALESHAVLWAANHPVSNDQGQPFRSPVKGIPLQAASPYDPTYDTLKSVAIKAVLGDDALNDMWSVLNQQRQGNQDVESYNRSFMKSLDLYVMCGGPGIKANLHQYRKLYRQGLNDSIRDRLFTVAETMAGEMAEAHKIERSLKMSGTLDAAAKPSSPSVFVMQTEPPPTVDKVAAQFAAAIRACATTSDLAEQLDTFSRGVCNKPLDTIGILQSHASGALDLNDIARETMAKAKAGTHILPIIASIHHLLPSELIRETFRSTKITEQHLDLKEVSKGELKRLRRLKEHVNKKHVSSDDDDDDDMEDRPDSKRRRSSRQATAAVFTRVADEMRQMNGNQAELMQSFQAALAKPPAGHFQANYPTAAVMGIHNPPHGAPHFQPQPQPPLPPPPSRPFPNKNTSRNIPKPWRSDRSWDGCKRCHALCHNRADECPGKDYNTPFCHYCCQDGHAITTCPELMKKSCTTCGRKGNDSRHCSCTRTGSKKD